MKYKLTFTIEVEEESDTTPSTLRDMASAMSDYVIDIVNNEDIRIVDIDCKQAD